MVAPEETITRDAELQALPALLSDLARAGVRLRVAEDGRLVVTAPAGRLSQDLRDRIAGRKPELVAWLARAGSGGALPTVVPDARRLFDPFPLADLQMSFLVGSSEGLDYHVRPHQYLELDIESLEPERFELALNAALRWQRSNLVVLRRDALLETVRDPEPLRVPVADLRRLPEAAALEAIEATRAEMWRAELPLDRWPWLDVRISRYGAGRARLHYNNNNFFSDALGTRRFLDTVLDLYRDPSATPPDLDVSYRDCVLALAELEESEPGRASRAYWCDRLAELPEAPALPLVPGADSRGRSRLNRRELVLPPERWAAFKSAATARGLTPTSALNGVYAEVLAYWSGSRHFLINNMITHRLPVHPRIGDVLGNFASLYPLEVDWRHDEPFHERAGRLQARMMSDLEHVYWSGVKVLEAVNQTRRTPGRAVCPFVTGSALAAGRFDRPVASLLETPQVLLDCELFELRDGSLWVVWDVIEEMFPDGLIDAMHAGYQSLLAHLVDCGDAWNQPAFDLLPPDQRRRRERANHTTAPVPAGRLHDPLPTWAAAIPNVPVVVSSGGTLGYADLHRRAGELAARLHRAGVRRGGLVAVVAARGWEQVVAAFGVLYAGAGYVPIDPDWPAERIRLLLDDAAVCALVTTRAPRRRLAAIAACPVLTVDQPSGGGGGGGNGGGGDGGGAPTDRAYVIYTSGTTGRPKGAVLDHRGPLNTIADVNRRFGIGRGDVVFGVSSPCFDLSVYDVFGTVAAGATLVLPDPGAVDPAAWIGLMRAHRVTVWNSVPAVMEVLVERAAAAGAAFPALRVVLLSGDWVPVGLPARIRAVAPNARVVALGGATEASIWSICHPVERDEPDRPSVPYGRPLANQTWYVLDDRGRDAPDWVAGHLHVGGLGVAQGYLNDPARTAAAFVAHPRTGERLYRTGDLGRYLPDGEIEFLGRADFQVKVQGFRVEPGEVEHALVGHPDVRQAVVIARESGSGRQLVAFAVPAEAAEAAAQPDPASLRGFLAERLPGHLVPDRIVVLDRLPLTPNGKLDRRALETTDQESDTRPPYVAARSATEAALVEIWESVLATGPVGVHDDFFALGGQSFAALRVIGMVERRWGRRVPLGRLLEGRTVAWLTEELGTAAAWSPLVRLREAGTGDPWFLVHPAGGSVLCYRGLARRLAAPAYAFQAPGPANGQLTPDRVEELAERYLGALLEVRPVGPYLLGGWSSGAVIAFELARRLERRGEPVRRLAVIDAPAPVAPRSVDEVTTLLWFLEDLGRGFDPDGPTGAEIDALAATAEPERLAAALALAARHGISRDDLDATLLAPAYAVFLNVVRACNHYRGDAVAADITVLRALRGRVSEFADHPAVDAPDWGWAALTRGRVTTTALDGTHHTLLTDRHVDAVAEMITRQGDDHAG